MSNAIKRVCVICLAFLLFLAAIPCTKVDGYDPAALEAGDMTNPLAWVQTSQINSRGTPEEVNTTYLSGGLSMAQAACSYYAMSFALIKHGSMDPKSETVVDFFKDMQAKGYYFDFGLLDYSKGSKIHEDIAEIYSTEECFQARGLKAPPEGYDLPAVGTAVKSADIKEAVQKILEDGYYIVMLMSCPNGTFMTNGHYIFIEDVEDGDLKILDSLSNTNSWDRSYGNYGGIYRGFNLIKFKDGKKPGDCASIWEEYTGTTGQTESKKDKDGNYTIIDEDDFELPDEWSLEGMPDKPDYKVTQVIWDRYEQLGMGGTESNEDRTANYSIQSEILGKTIADRQQDKVAYWVQVGMTMAGLILVVYSVVLLAAYCMDKLIPMSVSAVRLVTFGKVQVNFTKSTSRKYMPQGYYLMYVLLIMTTGLLIMSGEAYALVSRLMNP